jgi:hypothetical protein
MKVHLANSNAWSDGNEYIMGTASEVHTNALFDIYPNDTTITAEIKGNTVQSGTPSPSQPCDVVGVGELETSGEHAGQYKIPILNNSQTTNVYIGEVQTTRKIKKLVLTGQEDWWEAPYAAIPSLKRYGLTLSSTVIIGSRDAFCTHYVTTIVSNDSIQIGSNMKSLYISDNENGATLSDWKTYLQQQYSNGTPVCVWYVLATETTGIVNEPLMKIGDYADTISSISLTTPPGEKSFSVETAVKPSEITLNFRGWHPKNPKERTGGEWG